MNDFETVKSNIELEVSEKIIRYYAIPQGKNKGFIVAYGNWPNRSIRHNGWGSVLASRDMTENEIKYEKTCSRYHFDSYKTIEALLADEKGIITNNTYNNLYKTFAKLFQINPLKIKQKPKQLKFQITPFDE